MFPCFVLGSPVSQFYTFLEFFAKNERLLSDLKYFTLCTVITSRPKTEQLTYEQTNSSGSELATNSGGSVGSGCGTEPATRPLPPPSLFSSCLLCPLTIVFSFFMIIIIIVAITSRDLSSCPGTFVS